MPSIKSGWLDLYTDEDREWLIEACRRHDVRIISDEVYSGADRDWKPFFGKETTA